MCIPFLAIRCRNVCEPAHILELAGRPPQPRTQPNTHDPWCPERTVHDGLGWAIKASPCVQVAVASFEIGGSCDGQSPPPPPPCSFGAPELAVSLGEKITPRQQSTKQNSQKGHQDFSSMRTLWAKAHHQTKKTSGHGVRSQPSWGTKLEVECRNTIWRCLAHHANGPISGSGNNGLSPPSSSHGPPGIASLRPEGGGGGGACLRVSAPPEALARP